MLEAGILGSLFGGIFRIAPEILKFFDKKNEREHELRMFTLQTDLEKIRGEFRVEERYVDYSVSQMQAIQAAAEAEAKVAAASWKWVSAAVALVRPSITYMIFGMYLLVKITMLWAGFDSGIAWTELVKNNWTENDFGILMMILTFYFMGRPIEKYQKGGK